MTNLYFPQEDVVTSQMKALFEGAGYTAYKIRKFEEYSLYLENRSFLSDDHIITMSGQNGRLLALKPDITLSIVKNSKARPGNTEKLYYRESVYRFDKHSHEYQEISQVGVELMSDVGAVEETEMLVLALECLKCLGGRYKLSLSHMGFLSLLLDDLGLSIHTKEQVTEQIGAKNAHDLRKLLTEAKVADETIDTLIKLIQSSKAEEQKSLVLALATSEKARDAVMSLFSLMDTLSLLGYGAEVSIDFSVVSQMEYYTGIVFKGYAEGLSKAVLSGGRYDKLAQKFTPEIGAIGFAVYLGELLYHQKPKEFDTDVLLLYGEDTPATAVIAKAQELRAAGESVRIAASLDDGVRYRRLITL